MKKLIAISVVFALVAGAAFAEASVSGNVFGNITPLEGNTGKDAKGDSNPVTASGGLTRVRVEVSGENDDSTFGGYIRLERAPWWGLGSWGDSQWGWGDGGLYGQDTLVAADGNVWWKPIDQFKLTIGGNGGDGFFGADGITRWGFYQVANDVGVTVENWNFGASFYQGFGSKGAFLTITPMDALEINIGIPFFLGGQTKEVFMQTEAQVAYNIDGIGKFALTYDSGLGTKDGNGDWLPDDDGDGLPDADPGKLYLYFNLTAIENLGIDIGLGYTLPYTLEIMGTNVKFSPPIAAGLGVSFNAGEFGVKARVQGQLAGKSGEAKNPMVIDFDVLPSYAVSETLTALLSAGVKMTVPDEGDSVMGWHIQPYITLKSSWWAPNFYAGIRIDSDGVKDAEDKTTINWKVPIGIAIAF